MAKQHEQQEQQIEQIIAGFEIGKFQDKLLYWFEREQRSLPWRQNRDAYRVWVSEIMLQQTRVDTVIPYYERFMDKFPTVNHLADAELEQVYKLWEGLGYYSRARNLHAAVKEVQENYGGIIPDEPDKIHKLKGIGPYTAGAILSIAYGLPEPAVDGNVMRVLSRIFHIEEDIAKPKTRKLFEALVRGIISVQNPSFFNQALMELGALICNPRSPRCHECPVFDHCRAQKMGMEDKLPVKSKAKKGKTLEMAVALVQDKEGRWLLHKRPETGLLANLWEFPNTQADGGASKEVLSQFLFETFGVKAVPAEVVLEDTHVFSHLKWNLSVYQCQYLGIEESIIQPPRSRAAWVSTQELGKYTFSASHKKIAAYVSQ
ncbi:A/G-specific adenine glycosylase [Aneurinibacillus sp. Ricciae_BoGa-3]|uniref:A/G-specific adenine glycosylase n=1 Tax=Aneurinibacillus sp. Ricciae_BoGa-3 TaxID=3022697 RepID=UPI00233F85E1|nr:A/G-specific adenine glycosylase [Aneurinibacillus sp. Ricciae_BoGa-3]WCK55342.1 A/G-specific adenine glycosylase [Aneurinibacillus sp. Ricciae_BoGa-3]